MKFLDSLLETRFHVFGHAVNYAHVIGWVVGFLLFAFLVG